MSDDGSGDGLGFSPEDDPIDDLDPFGEPDQDDFEEVIVPDATSVGDDGAPSTDDWLADDHVPGVDASTEAAFAAADDAAPADPESNDVDHGDDAGGPDEELPGLTATIVDDIDWSMVPEANGTWPADLVASAADALGVDVAVVSADDPTATVAAFEQAGVDARIEHGDIDQLAEIVGDGGTVLLRVDDQGDSEVARLVAIDDASAEVELSDGSRRTLSRLTLERVWDDTAAQMVISGEIVMLPVTAPTVGGA